jgi:chromosome segregation ATPase
MPDETEVLPVPKVEVAPLARWTIGQFETRFAALTTVNTRRAEGVHKGETKILFGDMCETIMDLSRALKAEVDGGSRIKKDRAALRRMLRERDELIAHLRGENAGMGGLPVRAVAEVMGATRQGEQGAELILMDARRKASTIVADAEALLAKAKATAAAGPPTLTLPPEPKATKDPIADAAAQIAYIKECKPAIAQHRDALAAYERDVAQALAEVDDLQRSLDAEEAALGDRRQDVLAKLDEVEERRAQVKADAEAIDLSGSGVDGATVAMEVAS